MTPPKRSPTVCSHLLYHKPSWGLTEDVMHRDLSSSNFKKSRKHFTFLQHGGSAQTALCQKQVQCLLVPHWQHLEMLAPLTCYLQRRDTTLHSHFKDDCQWPCRYVLRGSKEYITTKKLRSPEANSWNKNVWCNVMQNPMSLLKHQLLGR